MGGQKSVYELEEMKNRIWSKRKIMDWSQDVPEYANLSNFFHVSVDFAREERVQSLLENSSNIWDVEKVQDIFNPHIVTEILNIKLGSTPRADRWIWFAYKFYSQ